MVRGHFLHRGDFLLPHVEGRQRVERLVRAQVLREPVTVEAAADPVAVQEKEWRARTAGLDRDDRLPARVRILQDVPCEMADGRPAQQERKRQLPPGESSRLDHHAQREKRIAAALEEVAVEREGVRLEQPLPDFEQLLLDESVQRDVVRRFGFGIRRRDSFGLGDQPALGIAPQSRERLGSLPE